MFPCVACSVVSRWCQKALLSDLGRQRVRRGDHTPIGQRHDFDSLSSGQFIFMVFRIFTRLM